MIGGVCQHRKVYVEGVFVNVPILTNIFIHPITQQGFKQGPFSCDGFGYF